MAADCIAPVKITHEDSQKACKLLMEMSNNINSVTELVNNLTEQISNDNFNTKKGLSLLELKNHTFLSYISNLVYTTLLKLSGKSLNLHPAIDRLIEQRVVIERLSPYESKLKHQIEKYLKCEGDSAAAGDEQGDASKGLSVDDFAAGDTDREEEGEDQEEEDEDEAQDDEEATDKGGERQVTYRVPKVSQNKFPDDDEAEDKAAAARRRLLNSAMMQDALYEHSQEPDVIQQSSALQKRAEKKREEIQRYEEDHLTRLPVSKKDRVLMSAGGSTAGVLGGELLAFSDVGVLTGETKAPRGKKRKHSEEGGGKKGKGKKKGSKRRH